MQLSFVADALGWLGFEVCTYWVSCHLIVPYLVKVFGRGAFQDYIREHLCCRKITQQQCSSSQLCGAWFLSYFG